MIASKTREKWNTKMVILITAILSFVLVVISFLLDTTHQDAKNILISVACSIWASNLIMCATSEYMLRSARRKEIIDKWGLESMFRTRAEMNSFSNLGMVSCKRHIDIIAFGLKNFREVKNDLIKSLLEDGVYIRILNSTTNVVPMFRIIEAVPTQIPQWAYTKNVIHHSASFNQRNTVIRRYVNLTVLSYALSKTIHTHAY